MVGSRVGRSGLADVALWPLPGNQEKEMMHSPDLWEQSSISERLDFCSQILLSEGALLLLASTAWCFEMSLLVHVKCVGFIIINCKVILLVSLRLIAYCQVCIVNQVCPGICYFILFTFTHLHNQITSLCYTHWITISYKYVYLWAW